MSKQTKNNNIKNNRIYFISSEPDEDLKKLDLYFNEKKAPFIDKIFKTVSTSKGQTNIFINIKLNTEVSDDIFKKMGKKLNNILNKEYKIYYIDINNNKFSFIPQNIINNINDSLKMFINDD